MLLIHIDIFPPKLIDRDLFIILYKKVCSKSFGYGQDSCAMIPLADQLNHNCYGSSDEMICTKVHPHGDRNDNYYRIDKFMANYERCFLGCEYTMAEIDECA